MFPIFCYLFFVSFYSSSSGVLSVHTVSCCPYCRLPPPVCSIWSPLFFFICSSLSLLGFPSSTICFWLGSSPPFFFRTPRRTTSFFFLLSFVQALFLPCPLCFLLGSSTLHRCLLLLLVFLIFFSSLFCTHRCVSCSLASLRPIYFSYYLLFV
jgi:hypothetical protein